MQKLLYQHQSELAAERTWLFVALSPNTSTNFKPSDISVNKIAANWRQFQLANSSDLQGLQDIDRVCPEFIEWWTARKSELRQRQSDPALLHNVRIYIAQSIWRMKIEQGCVFDTDLKPVVHLASFVFANLRGQVHEAFNRAVKIHQLQPGDNANQLLDDVLQNMMVEMIRASNTRLAGILDGKDQNELPSLSPQKDVA